MGKFEKSFDYPGGPGGWGFPVGRLTLIDILDMSPLGANASFQCRIPPNPILFRGSSAHLDGKAGGREEGAGGGHGAGQQARCDVGGCAQAEELGFEPDEASGKCRAHYWRGASIHMSTAFAWGVAAGAVVCIPEAPEFHHPTDSAVATKVFGSPEAKTLWSQAEGSIHCRKIHQGEGGLV
jgi:hypothetical protein